MDHCFGNNAVRNKCVIQFNCSKMCIFKICLNESQLTKLTYLFVLNIIYRLLQPSRSITLSKNSHFLENMTDEQKFWLTLSWPTGHIRPTYKGSFQVCWGNSIPLLLHAAVYLEVSLFHWNSQDAFSREIAMLQMIQCAVLHAALHTVSFVTWLFRGKMHPDCFNGIVILQGRRRRGEEVGYCYPSGLEKTLCKWDTYVPLVMKGLTQSESKALEKYSGDEQAKDQLVNTSNIYSSNKHPTRCNNQS